MPPDNCPQEYLSGACGDRCIEIAAEANKEVIEMRAKVGRALATNKVLPPPVRFTHLPSRSSLPSAPTAPACPALLPAYNCPPSQCHSLTARTLRQANANAARAKRAQQQVEQNALRQKLVTTPCPPVPPVAR